LLLRADIHTLFDLFELTVDASAEGSAFSSTTRLLLRRAPWPADRASEFERIRAG
jgi:hypothetical protein